MCLRIPLSASETFTQHDLSSSNWKIYFLIEVIGIFLFSAYALSNCFIRRNKILKLKILQQVSRNNISNNKSKYLESIVRYYHFSLKLTKADTEHIVSNTYFKSEISSSYNRDNFYPITCYQALSQHFIKQDTYVKRI